MTDLAVWLLDRIDADEAAARAQLEIRAERYPSEPDEPDSAYQVDRGWWLLVEPARVLAECDAKRRIIALGEKDSDWSDVLALLALPYADAPGWREEWRP
jgi:hypothetical protein